VNRYRQESRDLWLMVRAPACGAGARPVPGVPRRTPCGV